MTEQYYFRDTRKNAKSKEPFSISNPDVAKSWKREFALGEGSFEPVDDFEKDVQINRFDLQRADLNTTPNQVEAMVHNTKVLEKEEVLVVPADNPYKDMVKKDLVAELEARGIDFQTSGPESTNETYIRQLLADDVEEGSELGEGNDQE